MRLRLVAAGFQTADSLSAGTWGYQTVLEALADPTNQEHHDMLRWLGGPFDSERFDAASVEFDDPHERWRRAFEKGDPNL